MGRARSTVASSPRPRKRSRTSALLSTPPPEPEADPDPNVPRVVGDPVSAPINPRIAGPPARARVVAVMPEPPAPPRRLYIHFVGLDRRLDRWVDADKVGPPSAAPPVGADPVSLLPGVGAGAPPTTSRRTSRGRAAAAAEKQTREQEDVNGGQRKNLPDTIIVDGENEAPRRPVRTSTRATRGTRGSARVAAVAAAAAAAAGGQLEGGKPTDGGVGESTKGGSGSGSGSGSGNGNGNGSGSGSGSGIGSGIGSGGRSGGGNGGGESGSGNSKRDGDDARNGHGSGSACEVGGDSESKINPADRVVEVETEVETTRGESGAGRSVEPHPTRKVTRSRRRALEEFNPVSERETGNEVVARMERAREEHTKVRNIGAIVFGVYEVDAWYFSPYPGSCSNVDTLYICSFCLKYMRSAARYDSHCSRCEWSAPPGTLLYTDPTHKVTIHEVDGLVNVPYAQRLCLLGKLFLDHKTLYFDVAPFLFYVVCFDGELAGFFSKEKPLVVSEFNLACIVTLPQHQRKGLGRFLIALSYELTRREGKTGSPERPLSDLGQLSYRSYWMHAVMTFVRTKRGAVGLSAGEVASATGIRVADVTATLKSMGIVTIWKGETYVDTNHKALDQAGRRVSKPRLPLITSLLKWAPMKKPDPVHPLQPPRSPHPAGGIASAAGSSGPKGSSRRKPVRRSTGGSRTGGVASRVTVQGSAPSHARGRQNSSDRGLSMEPLTSNGAFTKDEIMTMKAFVLHHSVAKVQASLNSEDGLRTEDVANLAESLHMTLERCRKKLKRLSAAAVQDPSILTTGTAEQSLLLPSPAASPASSPVPSQNSRSASAYGAASAVVERVPVLSPTGAVTARPMRGKRVAPAPGTQSHGLPSQQNAGAVGSGPPLDVSDTLTEAIDGGMTPAASPDRFRSDVGAEASVPSSEAPPVSTQPGMPTLLLDEKKRGLVLNTSAAEPGASLVEGPTSPMIVEPVPALEKVISAPPASTGGIVASRKGVNGATS